MNKSDQTLLRDLLSNLQVEIKEAGYIQCPKTWRETDYIPSYNKFYLIESGEGHLRIDGEDFYPKPNQFFLMPCGVKQSYSYINGNTFRKYWVHFSALIGDVNLFDIVKTPLWINISQNSKVFKLFSDLEKSYNSKDELFLPLMAKSYIFELISFFIGQFDKNDILLHKNDEITRLNDVLQYINNNLEENITIKQLADVAFLHPNYFIRLFKDKMGISPIAYINKKRIEKAKELLKNHNHTIQYIAQQSGFPNMSHFFHMFKKQMGMTPKEYRQISK